MSDIEIGNRDKGLVNSLIKQVKRLKEGLYLHDLQAEETKSYVMTLEEHHQKTEELILESVSPESRAKLKEMIVVCNKLGPDEPEMFYGGVFGSYESIEKLTISIEKTLGSMLSEDDPVPSKEAEHGG